MTKKIEIEILLILFSLFAGTVKGQESMQQRISNIDIFALNLNLCEDVLYCPPPRISCIDFFNYVADMECYNINDDTKITQLLSCLKNLKPIKTERIDVKYKILFYSNDTLMYSACIGKSETLLDGFCYKNSEELTNFLFEIRKTARINEFRIPNTNKNVIVKGKSILAKRLKKISKVIDKDTNLYIRGICKADKNGEIVFVKLVQNPLIYPNMNGLIRKLEKIFRREVKFNENKERMISDVIPVKIRVTKNTVYYL